MIIRLKPFIKDRIKKMKIQNNIKLLILGPILIITLLDENCKLQKFQTLFISDRELSTNFNH